MLERLIPIFRGKNRAKAATQGCIVLAGDDIQQLSHTFMQQQKHNQKPMHVYQVITEVGRKGIDIQLIEAGLSRVYLDFSDQAALHHFINQVKQAGHVLELVIFQPTFNAVSRPNDKASEQITSDCISQGIVSEDMFSKGILSKDMLSKDITAKAHLSTESIEQQWQQTGLNAVSFSQAILKVMQKQRHGTLVLLGAQHQASAYYDVLGQSMFAAIRALSQSLAREFQPKGIHIAYCMLEQWDARQQGLMQSVSKLCWHLYQQPDSTWSQEVRV